MRNVILLILFTYLTLLTNGQERPEPFKIGDTLPDIEFMLLGQQGQPSKLSDYGNKALILDFWATWCVPCIAAFPRLDSLQSSFKSSLQILSITKEDGRKVESVLESLRRSRNISPVTVVGDSIFNTYFSYGSLPHYVWIDKQRIVKAVTSFDALTFPNVSHFIHNGQLLVNEEKKDDKRIRYKYGEPVFEQPDVKLHDSDHVYYSLLTRYLPGVPFSFGPGKNKIFISNLSAASLFAIAYFQGDLTAVSNPHRVMVLSRDSLKLTYGFGWNVEKIRNWNHEHLYCYNLKIPTTDSLNLYRFMQKDLERYFNLNVSIEKKEQKCLVIKLVGNEVKFKDTVGESRREINQYSLKYRNVRISTLIADLQKYYQYKNFTVVNETGYAGSINLDITGDITDVNILRTEFRKWGLDLIMTERPVDVLVLRDR